MFNGNSLTDYTSLFSPNDLKKNNIILKRHFLRKSGNFRQGQEVTDSDFAHFHIYYSYNSQKQHPKMF